MTAPDPDWWRCVAELLGQRCANAGTFSRSTHGGGPWYCAAHFFGLQDPGAGHAPTPEVRQQIHDIVDPKPRDLEADAERAAIQGESAW